MLQKIKEKDADDRHRHSETLGHICKLFPHSEKFMNEGKLKVL